MALNSVKILVGTTKGAFLISGNSRRGNWMVTGPFCDGWPEIERVELSVFSWNKPAIQTYAQLGFMHESTRRASARVGAERWDTFVMGLLRAEWVRSHGEVRGHSQPASDL